MSFLLPPLQTFFGDVVTDLKNSWRFRVWAVLWIPLVVTSFVAVIHLGIYSTLSKQIPNWRQQYVSESSGINYPDILVNAGAGSSFPVSGGYSAVFCNQSGTIINALSCPSVNGLAVNPSGCVKLPLSSRIASAANAGRNHITCSFGITSNYVNSNTEMTVVIPQGFIWRPNDPTYVQANMAAAVMLSRERLVTMDGRSADEWWTQVVYQSSDFFNTPIGTPFQANIIFRIPQRALVINTQYVDFDNYHMLGAWGGAIFFFWFLHSIVYKVLGLWLPNDSKLLATATAEAVSAYEPIK